MLCIMPSAAHATAVGLDRLGVRVVEGDILVSSNPYSRSIAVPATVQPWTDGVVPYRIDPDLPASSVRSINEAISRWNELSAVTLISLDHDDAQSGYSASLGSDSLIFQSGSGCASWVGRRGGVQEVWVAPNCTAGSVMHEIGHALGLEHEHTRSDRDQYITINWDNIDPVKRHNFDIAPAGSRTLGEYDYDSIMHYGPLNFSINQKPTISPLYASIDRIGQRQTPSQGDLAAIARMYASDLSVVTHVYLFNQTSEAAIHVSNDHAQGAHTITLSVSIGDSRLRSHNHNDWDCENSLPGQVECSLERLASGGNSILLLNLDSFVDPQSIAVEVRSKTPDDNPQNNINTANQLPSLGAATALQQDPTSESTHGGALTTVWLGLLFSCFCWRSLGRVKRQL